MPLLPPPLPPGYKVQPLFFHYFPKNVPLWSNWSTLWTPNSGDPSKSPCLYSGQSPLLGCPLHFSWPVQIAHIFQASQNFISSVKSSPNIPTWSELSLLRGLALSLYGTMKPHCPVIALHSALELSFRCVLSVFRESTCLPRTKLEGSGLVSQEVSLRGAALPVLCAVNYRARLETRSFSLHLFMKIWHIWLLQILNRSEPATLEERDSIFHCWE